MISVLVYHIYPYHVLSFPSFSSVLFDNYRFIASAGAQIGMKLIQIMRLWLTVAPGSVMYGLIRYTKLISTARRLGYQSFMHNLQLECLWEQPKVDRSIRLFVQAIYIYISINRINLIVVYNIEISTFYIITVLIVCTVNYSTTELRFNFFC